MFELLQKYNTLYWSRRLHNISEQCVVVVHPCATRVHHHIDQKPLTPVSCIYFSFGTFTDNPLLLLSGKNKMS